MNSSKKIRAFFAIDLSQPIISQIAGLQETMKKEFPAIVKWVNPNNQHITINFIDDLKEKDLHFLRQTLPNKISLIYSFLLTIKGIGAFPNKNSPRVLWLGITISKELERIFHIVESTVFQMGYPKENRKFSPHITLGRFQRFAKRHEIKIASSFIERYRDIEISSLQVNEISLYESNLTPKGPIYRLHFSIPLKRNRP